jgi:hypothetical protein|tara:strand:- start:310 stop:510 length:201 start_codon:yes stop_codon:yes gene_type:complete
MTLKRTTKDSSLRAQKKRRRRRRKEFDESRRTLRVSAVKKGVLRVGGRERNPGVFALCPSFLLEMK